jgi:MFS family permease
MAGQGISLIGTWVQQTALSWLIYRLTHSASLLGIVGFCSQIPSFAVAPFAGVLVDRVNKHRLIILTQTLSMIQAFALGLLVMTGTLEIWHIPLLSLFIGTVNAFDIPARQSYLIDIVGNRDLLGSAIPLNSSMVNIARIIGPTIAGALIAVVGEGMCFQINAASYIAVILSLVLMRNIPYHPVKRTGNVIRGLKEGFSYTFGFLPTRVIILQLGLASLAGVPYMVLLPIFARDIFHGGPHTLGYLLGASGAGALCGAVFLASRKTALGLEKIISAASLVFGVSLILFSQSKSLPFSLAMLVFTGFGMMAQMASSNTILQTIVDDDKRGRVMSFFTMAFIGMSPFGSLISGYLAGHLGAPAAQLAGGVALLLGTVAFTLKVPAIRKTITPTYEKLGIIRKPPL